MPSLPEPSPPALEHSRAVCAAIAREIDDREGWISFSRFMEQALYAPGLGYYSAGLDKFGAGGDFVTAPEISPLFGQTIAHQAAQVLRQTGGSILEIGAGSGKLALDLMLELECLEVLPERYFILELSADLRQRQQQRIEREAAHLSSRFAWLDSLPEKFTGLVLGNEVLDAMPVELITWRPGIISERGVALQDGRFVWAERALNKGGLLEQAIALPPAQFVCGEAAYTSEINLAAQGFMHSLGQMLERGLILMLDYGFGQSEYYHPQRSQGTLMCHYRHHAHGDPFFLPGLQDITAHVDFSAMAQAGMEAGMDLLGYASQANFLINCGLTDLLGQISPEDPAAYLPVVAQVQKLMSPAEMGELFKAIALGRGLEAPLLGFARGDRSHTL
ncbi:MAG: SAM-dependent methyltransferase [Sulfurimicrobium sp.]|nr:SAM-dependent methyltransferase [Sulfurimicrobium sp.]MDO9189173.1 SAM-dependent methyltransferase [Sulfurimicrobium sp.]MDP1705427.1 SAM-dependent methyltransferase [Sulfurimicrobium sp.]MDP2198810.1 SAM-dependent methyltransferase [Sulfurimicrobium sp.]MDP2963551.1 SAM-dependent methyltransferase [Sulfurimicrobium sp.]